MESRSLAETVVVVTGASSGVGEATARMLVDRDARVVLGARNSDAIDQLATELGPERALAVPCDVGNPGDCRRLVAAAVRRFGQVDSLIASAGIGAYGGICDYTDDELSEMMTTNIAGTVWSIRAAVPAMTDGGDIVIVSSVAGIRGGEHEAVYAATKFAQVGLAGAVDRELRPRGIRVTAMCPAAIATNFAMGRGRTAEMPELDAWMSAEDVAGAIVFALTQPRRLRTTQWHMWSAAEAS